MKLYFRSRKWAQELKFADTDAHYLQITEDMNILYEYIWIQIVAMLHLDIIMFLIWLL